MHRKASLSSTFPFVLLLLTLSSPPARGQRVAVANSRQHRVDVIDHGFDVIASFTDLGDVRYVANDGLGTVWATAESHGVMHRLDIDSGTRETLILAGAPRGVALCPDRGVVVVSTSGSLGQLDRYGADGTWRWAVTIPAQPRLVAVDRGGHVWVVHEPAAQRAILAHYSALGALLSSRQVGYGPGTLVCDRSGRVLVLCRHSADLYVFDAEGLLLDRVPLDPGSQSLSVLRGGGLALTFPTVRAVEVRDRDAGVAVRVPAQDRIDGSAADGRGGVWVTASSTGNLDYVDASLTTSGALPLGRGVQSIGDATGLAFAASAGAALDLDGDGVPSGYEIDAGSNPLDEHDRPFDLTPQGPLSPGRTVALSVRSAGSSRGLFWLGASTLPATWGAGVDGFSLAADDFYRLFRASGRRFVSAQAGQLDRRGAACVRMSVPPEPGLRGFRFYMAFVVFEDFPRLEALPSPAFVMVIS